jgi:hypothetical protein
MARETSLPEKAHRPNTPLLRMQPSGAFMRQVSARLTAMTAFPRFTATAALAGLLLMLHACQASEPLRTLQSPLPPSPDDSAEASTDLSAAQNGSAAELLVIPSPDLPAAELAAESGPVQVSGLQIVKAAQFRRLMAHLYQEPDPLPADWGNDTRLVEDLAMQVLLEALLDREAAARRLTAADVEIDAELEATAALSRLHRMEPDQRDVLMAQFAPLTWNDVRRSGARRILHQRWLDAVTEVLTDNELRRMYDLLEDQMQLLVALVPNTPSDIAVDRLLSDTPDRVDEWYAEHRGWYLTPRRASIRRVLVPADVTSEAAAAAARELATQWRNAFATGRSPVDAPTPQLVEVVEAEFAEAFRIDSGAWTPVVQTDAGFVFAQTVSVSASEVAPLDDNLRRRIARQILEQTRPQPEPLQLARAIHSAMQANDQAALVAALNAARVETQTTPFFSRGSGGSIPLLGEVPQAHASLFVLLNEPGDMPDEPFITPHGIAVVKLVERRRPTDEKYETDRELFRATITPGFREQAWSSFSSDWFRSNPPQFYPEPVRNALSPAPTTPP